MTLQFRLSFIMRQRRFDFGAIVSKAVWDQVAAELDDRSGIGTLAPFISFRTMDGTLELVNRNEVNAVRHRSDVIANTPAAVVYEGPVQIHMIGRSRPLEEWPSSNETLADFIIQLEHGPDVVPVVRFLDDNEETMRLLNQRIVRVTVSTECLDAGYEALNRE